MDPFEKLKETKQLLDEGIINEDEYQDLKTRLLNEMDKEKPAEVPVFTTQTMPNTSTAGFATSNESATTGMKILSFLIPLVGLILFIVDKDKKPVAAKDELMWAGIGFGVGVVLYIITVGMAASMY